MKRAVWVLSILAGCATAPIDVYPAAARAVDEGQLLRALAYLDQIPPAHPHYPDARTLAQAVERRLRRSQELVLEGLELRAQWRDDEALARFEEAQLIWTAAVGVDAWIEATRNRIDAARVSTAPTPAGEVRASRPEVQGDSSRSMEARHGGGQQVEIERDARDPAWTAVTNDAATTTAPVVPGDAASTTDAEPTPIVQVPPTAGVGVHRAGKSLTQIESLIEAGDLQTALDDLDARVQRDGADRAARDRLVQVLHQRALQSYGRGWLDMAIADWGRLLQVDAAHQQARSFMQAAAAEHGRRAGTAATAPR